MFVEACIYLSLDGEKLLIDGVTLEEVLLEDTCGPNSELCASLAFDTIAHRYDDIKVVEFEFLTLCLTIYGSMWSGCKGILDYHFLLKFTFSEDVAYMEGYILFCSGEQFCHLHL